MPSTYEPRGNILGGIIGLALAFSLDEKLGGSDNSSFLRYLLTLAIVAASVLGGAFMARAFHRMIWDAMNPTLSLEMEIAERKKIAEEKGIFQMADIIVSMLGDGSKFEDERLVIQRLAPDALGRLAISQADLGQWHKAFEGHVVKGEGSTSGGTYLRPTGGGEFKIEQYSSSAGSPDKIVVDLYISGEWEKHLRLLAKRAVSVRDKKRQDAEKARAVEQARKLEEKARNFGL